MEKSALATAMAKAMVEVQAAMASLIDATTPKEISCISTVMYKIYENVDAISGGHIPAAEAGLLNSALEAVTKKFSEAAGPKGPKGFTGAKPSGSDFFERKDLAEHAGSSSRQNTPQMLAQLGVDGATASRFLRREITRYLAKGGDRALLPSLVRVGTAIVAKSVEVEIPAYKQVFSQMDESPRTEVYLGRDGLYAIVARHVQMAARRLRGGRRKAVKYLVFSRAFLWEQSSKQRGYLSQEGIDALDPVFYDTGYAGTIPTAICQILEKSLDDDRVVMLSANKESWRARGLAENLRGDIVASIEHNVKPTLTAEGLKESEGGALVPVAPPSSLEEQFLYRLLKGALRAAFFNQKPMPAEFLVYLDGEVIARVATVVEALAISDAHAGSQVFELARGKEWPVRW